MSSRNPADWPRFTISGTRKEFIIQDNTWINNLFIPVGISGTDRMLGSVLTGSTCSGRFCSLDSGVLNLLETSCQLLASQS